MDELCIYSASAWKWMYFVSAMQVLEKGLYNEHNFAMYLFQFITVSYFHK